MSTWQFVDSIASSPTVRLDLNSYSGGLMLAGEPEISPPQMRRVVTSSMLADGELIPAAAWANRTIRIPLQLTGQTTADLAASKLQALARELTRPTPGPGQPNNILRVTVASNPMFFRTFPAPDAAYQLLMKAPHLGNTTLEIPCEPWGYGLKEVLSGVTVTNNPAAGANGMFLDITSPKGDVEAPLTIAFTNGLGATGRIRSGLSVRRRGTVANTPLFLQAEAMTQGTDTTTQANSAVMSGAGNNFSRCTFATNSSGQQRLTVNPWPSGSSTDYRGQYRVFARVRKTVGTDAIDVQLQWGTSTPVISNDIVALPNDTNIKYVDLGMIQFPGGYDPVNDGISGVELAAQGTFISLYARRTSGSGNLDVDLLLFMPADDCFEFIKWPTTQLFSTDVFVAEGGETPATYCLDTTGYIRTTETIEGAGGGLMITPGRTNRVFFARDLGTGTALLGTGDSVTATNVLTCSYFPRYLYPLKPVST